MLYAQTGRVRTFQIVSDCVLVGWCLIWALIGRTVFSLVNTLRGPAEDLNRAASGLSEKVASINGSLPSFLQGPLGSVGGNADSLGDAATKQGDSVTHVASILGWSTALVPIILAVLLALFFRGRWFLRVRNATKYKYNQNFEELLARRAVMHQPLAALAKVSQDPLADLERGHYEALAKLELADLGINPQSLLKKVTRTGLRPGSTEHRQLPPRD